MLMAVLVNDKLFHVSYFNNGDLVLIGSNLPHCGFTNKETGNRRETVIQWKPNFLGDTFFSIAEMQNINKLFEVAKSGIMFTGATQTKIGDKMETMEYQTDFQRLLSILNILNDLATTKEYEVLNAEGFSLQTEVKDNDRINVVFNHVRANFTEPITLEDISDKVSMTVPSFCRYFKMTNKTFTQFVNEYTIGASKLLAEQNMSITEVCLPADLTTSRTLINRLNRLLVRIRLEYRHHLKT